MEPGTNSEIKEFAKECYGAEFPMFAKSDVNGVNTNEVFNYLRRNSKLQNKDSGRTGVIPWNFSKFIVSTQYTDMEYMNPRIDMKVLCKYIDDLMAK